MATGSALPSSPSEQVLLAEYSSATQVYLQYDGFRWQAGSFLIAGVFVYWGFLIQADSAALLAGLSSLLVAALMSCWLLFAMHYRQLYLQKLHRIQEIEVILGEWSKTYASLEPPRRRCSTALRAFAVTP